GAARIQPSVVVSLFGRRAGTTDSQPIRRPRSGRRPPMTPSADSASRWKDAARAAFADPPAEYGPIDGWWWEAGRLDRDRMRWQLEELKDKGIAGSWFYARYVYDEPLASEPRYFTDGWWEFTRFAAEEHQRLGLRNFFSVWTQLE